MQKTVRNNLNKNILANDWKRDTFNHFFITIKDVKVTKIDSYCRFGFAG
jgi:hypothetical protein